MTWRSLKGERKLRFNQDGVSGGPGYGGGWGSMQTICCEVNANDSHYDSLCSGKHALRDHADDTFCEPKDLHGTVTARFNL